jgi:hypothetical protein
MYTSIVLAAAVGFVPGSSEAKGPAWQTNYAQARKEAKSREKPLAVFLGTGKNGHTAVCRDGKLSAEVRRLLAARYVCVHVDTGSEAGRRLAADMQVKQATGLVLSDRSGDYQAFRYGGTLTEEELTRSLKRFSAPDYVVRTTVTEPNEQISYYPPESSSQNTSNSYDTGYYTPSYAPPVYGGFGGFGGGFGGGRGC